MMHLAAAFLVALAQNNDKAQANGYDDGWKSQWKANLRLVLSTSTVTKTPGFVLQVGDSITHSNPYGQWARGSTGKTAEDNAVCVWAQTTTGFPGNNTDPTQTNGFYLALADTNGGRGMTASSGIAAFEFISGAGNNPVNPDSPMPSITTSSSARTAVSSTQYQDNLRIETVAAAFNTAQFAVVMLGTNDIGNGRSTTQFNTDLGNIVTALENEHIGVILSTIPPYIGQDVTAYNAAIRAMAQARSLPLIDFYSEILARRPGTSWQGTLIKAAPDNKHPTDSDGTYNSSSDPYANGGSTATHKTGAACQNVGYLLRSWLTIQKLKEVHSFVILDNPPVASNPTSPTPGPGPGPGPGPTPTANPGDGEGDDSKCGGSIGGPVSPWMLVGTAFAVLALLGASRKTGV